MSKHVLEPFQNHLPIEAVLNYSKYDLEEQKTHNKKRVILFVKGSLNLYQRL